MNRHFFSQIADLGAEIFEFYWIVGLLEDNGAWFFQAVMLGVESNSFSKVSLPIGLLPMLSLGQIFTNGKMLSLSARGIHGNALISDVSDFEEITSNEIPPALYSFNSKKLGVQRLFRYRSTVGVVLIPVIELIRYLFLHNRTLADAIMRPGALNLLFHPEMPGFRQKLDLQFTKLMPKGCLSDQFAQEFAWLAVDSDARRAWDSVCLQTKGQQYVSFIPPSILNSTWKFRGILHDGQWLVLELLHITGKMHPCDELTYGHPSMKAMIYSKGTKSNSLETESEDDSNSNERVLYDYELDDGRGGAKVGGLKMTDARSKNSGFDRDITVKKIVIQMDGQESMGAGKFRGHFPKSPEISVHKKIKALNIQKYSGLIKPKICFEDVLAGWIPGDRVRVTLPSIPGLKSDSAPGRGKSRRTHTGLVLQVHKRYILVQLPGWRECVNVGTVIAGEAQIELLERGKVA